ncbi:MAG: type II toxin-antitoxin system RelB/DinJ family antitoxin [Clostridiales bacterium]|nr:type II toxin-antitoxin system RelB/DinJ family antitoxin [Clostridiales bacterium]
MATKTSTVNLRIEYEVKRQAEDILNRLGIPRAVAIDMFYRQIIAHNGIPFSLTLPTNVPSRDTLSKPEFDYMISNGIKQAQEGDSFDVDEVFEMLETDK